MTSPLEPLLELFPEERVASLLGSHKALSVPDPVRGFLLARIVRHLDAPVLAVTARIEEAEHIAREVQSFLGRGGAEVFPGWEVLPGEPISPSVDTMGRRLHSLSRLQRGDRFVVVTTAQGAIQLVAPPSGDVSLVRLRVGDALNLDEFSRRLVEMGYDRNYLVERRGEFAIRGGILDVFSPAHERPVRIELWGDDISSVRNFALASQRSLDEIEEIEIAPSRELRPDPTTMEQARELAQRYDDPVLATLAEGVISPGAERLLPLITGGLVPLRSFFAQNSIAVIVDSKRVRDRAEEVLEQVDEWGRLANVTDRHYASLDEVLSSEMKTLEISGFIAPGTVPDGPDVPDEPGAELPAETWVAAAGKPEALVERLRRLIADGYAAVVAASLPDTASRLKRNLESMGPSLSLVDRAGGSAGTGGGSVVVAELDRGFVLPWAKLALVAESDITGRRSGAHRRRMLSRRRRVPTGPLDLADEDLVVHEIHGIGRYRGMVDRELLGVHREYLVVEYARGDRLYVPSDQVDLVSKYVGGEAPRISRLGSPEWKKTKSRVRRRTAQIAAQLVKLYAERSRTRGVAFSPDTPWQRELEDSFPYEETPDQIRAIDEVKDDMEQPVPMDRLVCADVGYGKTEIAVRAAFKAVADDKQVALLVPTTILAQQHHATLRERFRHFPVRVEMLSRFLSPGETKKVITDLAAGKVDVVVGTHRLIQPDVKFADLGLLIVDEEQRFGVEQKEKVKSLRANVDVLTLTATPIPRTMEMAMSGIRNMSIVDTPPENRHPVMTYVGDYDENTVASAIRRELLRDGQVFYVHPRVATIQHVAHRLQTLVPEARIGTAHGRMPEAALEQTMIDFGDAKINVLVSTTIIESGLDIPTVNTLIVERADLLGLSQLYQLRGRVGRAHERAYAYLFYPGDRKLTEEAYERLKTVGEHTGLGSGFRIAMRDLEIRGAGNLLGAEQHGHIAEVGFDLYVKMMASAFDQAKGLPWREEVDVRIDLPLDAYIPKDYVTDENLRLEAYRRIASAADRDELEETKRELIDRYGGPLPPPVEGLFEVAALRRLMIAAGITEAATVARMLRVRPIELEESRQVRLQRILPESEWRPPTRTLLIPERTIPEGNVVTWLTKILEQLTSSA